MSSIHSRALLFSAELWCRQIKDLYPRTAANIDTVLNHLWAKELTTKSHAGLEDDYRLLDEVIGENTALASVVLDHVRNIVNVVSNPYENLINQSCHGQSDSSMLSVADLAGSRLLEHIRFVREQGILINNALQQPPMRSSVQLSGEGLAAYREITPFVSPSPAAEPEAPSFVDPTALVSPARRRTPRRTADSLTISVNETDAQVNSRIDRSYANRISLSTYAFMCGDSQLLETSGSIRTWLERYVALTTIIFDATVQQKVGLLADNESSWLSPETTTAVETVRGELNRLISLTGVTQRRAETEEAEINEIRDFTNVLWQNHTAPPARSSRLSNQHYVAYATLFYAEYDGDFPLLPIGRADSHTAGRLIAKDTLLRCAVHAAFVNASNDPDYVPSGSRIRLGWILAAAACRFSDTYIDDVELRVFNQCLSGEQVSRAYANSVPERSRTLWRKHLWSAAALSISALRHSYVVLNGKDKAVSGRMELLSVHLLRHHGNRTDESSRHEFSFPARCPLKCFRDSAVCLMGLDYTTTGGPTEIWPIHQTSSQRSGEPRLFPDQESLIAGFVGRLYHYVCTFAGMLMAEIPVASYRSPANLQDPTDRPEAPTESMTTNIERLRVWLAKHGVSVPSPAGAFAALAFVEGGIVAARGAGYNKFACATHGRIDCTVCRCPKCGAPGGCGCKARRVRRYSEGPPLVRARGAVRRVGMELEFEARNDSALQDLLERYPWCHSDSSLSGAGAEIKIIGYSDRLPLLAQLIARIAADPAVTSPANCGFHVHVERKNSDDIDDLRRRWLAIENDMFSLFPSRFNNNFCAPLSSSSIEDHHSVLSLSRHGTIEFRIHPGTASWLVAACWADWCVRFMYGNVDENSGSIGAAYISARRAAIRSHSPYLLHTYRRRLVSPASTSRTVRNYREMLEKLAHPWAWKQAILKFAATGSIKHVAVLRAVAERQFREFENFTGSSNQEANEKYRQMLFEAGMASERV